eukprot:1138666-Pelagomonas_calceolata.AAC.4
MLLLLPPKVRLRSRLAAKPPPSTCCSRWSNKASASCHCPCSPSAFSSAEYVQQGRRQSDYDAVLVWKNTRHKFASSTVMRMLEQGMEMAHSK